MDISEVASTSDRTQRSGAKLSWSSRSLTRSPIDELSEQEFHACFYMPDSISFQLSNREASSIDKLPNNMIYFIEK